MSPFYELGISRIEIPDSVSEDQEDQIDSFRELDDGKYTLVMGLTKIPFEINGNMVTVDIEHSEGDLDNAYILIGKGDESIADMRLSRKANPPPFMATSKHPSAIFILQGHDSKEISWYDESKLPQICDDPWLLSNH